MTNPFESARETVDEQLASDAAVLADVESVSDDGSVAAVSNVGKDAKYAVRVPDSVGETPVGSSVLVATASNGQPYVQHVINRADTGPAPDTGSSYEYLNLNPDSPHVTNVNYYDNTSQVGMIFIDGTAGETVPSGAPTSDTSGSYWTTQQGYNEDWMTLDFSEYLDANDNPIINIDFVAVSGSTSYKIIDDGTGDVLREVGGNAVGNQIFSLSNTSGVFNITSFDAIESRYILPVSATVEEDDYYSWERPTESTQNFATSGSGETWESFVNGTEKTRYSPVSSVTANSAVEYTYRGDFDRSDIGTAVDSDTVYAYLGGRVASFDRDTKETNWITSTIGIIQGWDNAVNFWLDNDTLYIGGTGTLAKYDATNGSEIANISPDYSSITGNSNPDYGLVDMYPESGDFIVVVQDQFEETCVAIRLNDDGSVDWQYETDLAGSYGTALNNSGELLIAADDNDTTEDLWDILDISNGTVIADQWYSDLSTTGNDTNPIFDGSHWYSIHTVGGTNSLVKINTDGTFNDNVAIGANGETWILADGNQIYVHNPVDDFITAFDTSLTQQWQTSLSNPQQREIVMDNDNIYLRDNGNLVAVDVTDGSKTTIYDGEFEPFAAFDNELYGYDGDGVVKLRELA
jgi:hypothetical protein